MLRRITSRITPSGVIATIALFAALGGGYAAAFSGSGTLQKAAVADVGTNFEDVRTLTGFGVLRARCDPTQNEAEYQFENTRDEPSQTIIVKQVRDFDGQAQFNSVPSGTMATLALGSGENRGTMRMHLFRENFFNDPPGKAQVDLVASNEGFADNCATETSIWVLALNTQE
jgi:hypothetical protein